MLHRVLTVAGRGCAALSCLLQLLPQNNSTCNNTQDSFVIRTNIIVKHYLLLASIATLNGHVHLIVAAVIISTHSRTSMSAPSCAASPS